MDIPQFTDKKERFDFLIKNKEILIAQKKAVMKHADAIIYQPYIINSKGEAVKSEDMDMDEMMGVDKIKVMAVINTTNIIDSHKDCHMKGIWTKSLQENKMLMHLQEHNMSFKAIIADGKDLKAYVKTMSWLELGYNYPGTTEALVFESIVKRDRNEYMFDQYKKGYVRNHSVGMSYVKIATCINDEDYANEYLAWQKYYPEVSNKEVADEQGYFWAITEAKVIEGSAVPRGSNMCTPTMMIEEVKNQPPEGTDKHTEPPTQGTQAIDYKYLSQNFKLK